MLTRSIVALSLLLFGTSAMADAIDLNLRNSAAQFRYSSAMGREALGKTSFYVGALYSSAKRNYSNTLGEMGLLVQDEVGSQVPGFSVGVGIKGLLAHTQGTNESAIGIGGLIRYSPPGLSRMGIVGQVYFAPDITTFGDANRYVETGLRLEYDVIPNAAAYIGYRNIYFNFGGGVSATVDEGVFLGVMMSF